MISSSLITTTAFSSDMNFRSLLSRISVSNSVNEPSEMCKKWMNSFLPFRAAPSAILTGTETADLLICDTNPNRSSTGNELVTPYKTLTISKLLIQEFNFLCGFIVASEMLDVKCEMGEMGLCLAPQ
jgi:hypothetical protein